jgi:transcriptional regulator, XRE family
VSVESLREIPLESSRQALELLFRLSDHFSLQPLEKGGEVILAAPEGSKIDPKLASALKA